MLDDPGYRRRWERKRKEYIAAGILPWDEGGGPEGILVETQESAAVGLDSAHISELIQRVVVDF